MKVILTNPFSKAPNPILPLGLAYISSYLEEQKIAVEVIDAWVEAYDENTLEQNIKLISRT